MNKTISKLLVFFLAFTMIVGMHIVDAAPGSNNGKGSDKSNSSNNSPNSPHLKNDTDTKGHDPKQDDKDGITITNLEPGKEYEVKVTAPGKKGDTLNETTKVTADENGNAIISVEGETSNPGGVYHLEVDGVKSKNFKVKDSKDNDNGTPPGDDNGTPPGDDNGTPPGDDNGTPPGDDNGTPPGDDNGTPPDGGTTTSPSDDGNDTVVLSEEDSTLPQGQPIVTENVDMDDVPQSAPPAVETPEEVIETEEIQEPAPQAVPTLPATGAGSGALFSGLGTILMGLGLALKKRF